MVNVSYLELISVPLPMTRRPDNSKQISNYTLIKYYNCFNLRHDCDFFYELYCERGSIDQCIIDPIQPLQLNETH